MSSRSFCIYPRFSPLPIADSPSKLSPAAARVAVGEVLATPESPWLLHAMRVSAGYILMVFPLRMEAGNPLSVHAAASASHRRLNAGGMTWPRVNLT